MDNKVILNKDIEIVIITCFGPNRDKRLIAAEIKDHVKKYLYENDSNIQKKIERMAKNGYLLHETLSNGKFLYCISNEMEFTFTHAPPEPLRKEMKLTATDIVSHSLQLQEAIRAWMDNLPEVDPAYSIIKNPEKSIITACEAHPLFHDLANHLPERDIFIFEKWQNYRDGLLRLQEHKQHLYNSLRDEILKCFSGQDLRFVFDSEHHLENYECYLNPQLLYNTVMHLESDDEGFHNYEMLLSWLECNSPIVEKDNHLIWGEIISYLRVPLKDRALLDTGVPKFLAFLRNIQNSEYIEIAFNIMEKAEGLNETRTSIIKDLERASLYSSFPGACQYIE